LLVIGRDNQRVLLTASMFSSLSISDTGVVNNDAESVASAVSSSSVRNSARIALRFGRQENDLLSISPGLPSDVGDRLLRIFVDGDSDRQSFE